MSEPKCRSSSRFGYSEKEMAEAFGRLLRSKKGLPELGSFDAIYSEITCRQGRPDFIALRYKSSPAMRNKLAVPGFIGPAIVQHLKDRSPRTLDYLVDKLEFGRRSIQGALREMIEVGCIEQRGKGGYVLASLMNNEKPEIWAFELKLNNPKKAVFQAQQCRAYAERSIIVVPPGQETNYDRFDGTLQRWYIGLSTFDPITGRFRVTRKGRKAKALSPEHQIYTLSQVARVYE